MVEYIESDVTEVKVKKQGFPKGLYLIHIFGVVFGMNLVMAWHNYANDYYILLFFNLLLCVIFMPPLSDSHLFRIHKSFQRFLR